jgi:hypothetical protein
MDGGRAFNADLAALRHGTKLDYVGSMQPGDAEEADGKEEEEFICHVDFCGDALTAN